jgi:hypothetical protein
MDPQVQVIEKLGRGHVDQSSSLQRVCVGATWISLALRVHSAH